MGYIGVKLKAPIPGTPVDVSLTPPVLGQGLPVVSPDDRLGQAIEELRQSAETELLELLSRVSPTYFETIVLDLLHRRVTEADHALPGLGGRDGPGE